jgi:hypothetical protein
MFAKEEETLDSEIVELVNKLCKGFDELITDMGEDRRTEMERMADGFTFPPVVSVDFLMGVLIAILQFVHNDAPTETRIYASLYSTGLGRAIASGKIKVVDKVFE